MRLLALLVTLAIYASSSFAESLHLVVDPVSAALSKHTCGDYAASGEHSVCLDRVFDVTYRVKQVLSGQFDQPEINVIDFYHGHGLPNHLTWGVVCAVLLPQYGTYVHKRSVPAMNTKSGYVCEEPLE